MNTTAETNKPAVKISNLHKSYHVNSQVIHAVRGLNLTIPRGVTFGIIGPDGAGKTSTIQMMVTIHQPDSGSIEILGQDVVEEREQVRGKVGYLSQRFSLYGDLSVSENIDFFARLHGVTQRKKIKAELLRLLRLAPFENRLAQNLSGGMKQKLALACTLVHKPEIIILDEPTTGVDPLSRRDFWRILAEFQKQGLTIVVSTPYMDEAERCHLTALLWKGQLLTSGSPEEVKRQSCQALQEMVCHPIRLAQQKLHTIEGCRRIHSFGDRLHFELSSDGPTMHQIVERLQSEHITIESYGTTEPSMEDAFIALVEGAAKEVKD